MQSSVYETEKVLNSEMGMVKFMLRSVWDNKTRKLLNRERERFELEGKGRGWRVLVFIKNKIK